MVRKSKPQDMDHQALMETNRRLERAVAELAILNDLAREIGASTNSEEIMEKMQGAGIASGVVKNAKDIFDDPQLRHRGFFWPETHLELGDFTVFGQPAKLSKTPARFKMPSPVLGEHTEYVCTKILGMSDDEFVDLFNSGALN